MQCLNTTQEGYILGNRQEIQISNRLNVRIKSNNYNIPRHRFRRDHNMIMMETQLRKLIENK